MRLHNEDREGCVNGIILNTARTVGRLIRQAIMMVMVALIMCVCFVYFMISFSRVAYGFVMTFAR